MARANRKGKHRSSRGSRAKGADENPRRSSPRIAVLTVSIAAGIVLLWGIAKFGPLGSREGAPSPQPGQERPTVDVAAALGLTSAPPGDVEALRAEAISVAETLVSELPNRPEAYAVLALTRYRYGLKEESMDAWNQARRVNPSFSPAWTGIGVVAADKGQDEVAIAALRRAIELNPDIEEAYAKLVEVLLRQNETREALDYSRRFVQRFPDSRKASYWLGQTYLQTQQYEDAIAAHEAVIRQHPDLTPSYYSLAMAHARLGHRDEAARFRKRFADLKERDLQKERDQNREFEDLAYQRSILAATHLSAGSVRLHAGDYRKAEAHWLRGIQVCAEDVPCRKSLAGLCESQERWHGAAATLAELAELTPDDTEVWLQLARVRERLGLGEEAETAYRRAIAAAPGDVPAYLGLLRHALQSDRTLPDAVPLARKAVELAPSPDTYLLLSTALEQSHDRAGALAAVERALELAPGHPSLRQVYEQLSEDR